MTDVERTMTLHPEGKNGVNIETAKYQAMRTALISVISGSSDGTATGELTGLVEEELDQAVFPPDSKLTWYVITVKQDLEARGLIEIVPNSKPQRVRLTS